MLPFIHQGAHSCPNLSSMVNHQRTPEQAHFAQKTTAVSNVPQDMTKVPMTTADKTINDPVDPLPQTLCRRLDMTNGDLLATLAPNDLMGTENMLDDMERLLRHGADIPLTAMPGTVEHQISRRIGQELREHANAGVMERGRLMIDIICGVLRNDVMLVQSDTARHVANIVSVGIRTGIIVGLTTLLRQLIGFALEKKFQQMGSASASLRLQAGIASMLLGPGLNLAGAIRDEKKGNATTVSRFSRLGMAILSAAGLMMTCGYRLPATIGFLMGSFGVQTACYTLSRDVIQLFFPLHDNGGLNLKGLACSSLSYGVAQFILGECMTRYAPNSGAGFAMSEIDRLADPETHWIYAAGIAAAAITPHLTHDMLRCAFNALTEVFDDVQRPVLMRVFGASRGTVKPKDRAGKALLTPPMLATSGTDARIGLARPRIGAGHWPTMAQAADQFLTTNAMRTSFFEAIVGITVTVAAGLDDTPLSKSDRALAVNAMAAGLVILGYPAFIGAHDKTITRTPDAK
ncbi:hypothetical protein SJI19_19775 [Acerihabitans sp. TG2]|uniref:hypothetical protein n=1 Tax=Acerihabitans sp. TG2 TaxID=3096008 RepID=UPI002B2302F9|nr:hypothetical protein [Acerihabitans sp. TG2]MEA9392745.1 hypothetical protein [Acerihabitans sp. TG2]